MKGYADMVRYTELRQALLNHGVDTVHITTPKKNSKNGADIRMTVDIMNYLLGGNSADVFVLGTVAYVCMCTS